MPLRIYRVTPLQLNDALVIVSDSRSQSGDHLAEAIMLRRPPSPACRGLRVCNPASFSDTPALIADEIGNGFAPVSHVTQWALGALDSDLLAWAEKQPPAAPYPDSARLHESDASQLLAFCQHTGGEASLRQALAGTENPELKVRIDRALAFAVNISTFTVWP